LKKRKHIVKGVDIVFASDIPIGAGVSSSSAICCGFIFLLNGLFELKIPLDQQIAIASEAEQGMGLKGGIMDQYSILKGKEGQALLIDCEVNKHQEIPLNLKDHSFVLVNSSVKHNLIDSDYNDRRSEVEEGLAIVKKEKPNKTFRTLNTNDLKPSAKNYKRLCHVVNEISRVKEAVDFIENQNYEKLGKLLKASHLSLKDDYEVSCEEVDFLVSEINSYDGVLGSRMMGGGFGGSIITLVDKTFNRQNWNKLSDKYYNSYSLKPEVLEIESSNGVTLIEKRLMQQ